MKYPRIMARLFNTPLMVRPSYARTVAHVLSSRMGDYEVEDGEIEMIERPPRSMNVDDDGILTVPVLGGLYHRGDDLDAMSGAQSYMNLKQVMIGAMDNPEVKGILLDIDSPGGEAGGCFSFAKDIQLFAKKKPIWAVANTQASSAAYAMASACDKFYAPSDAAVGSIGVVWLHMDYSEHLKQNGIVATYVYAGKHKKNGNPFEALDGEAKAEIQKRIDDRYEQFVGLVAANRGMSADAVRATEAREYLADEAHDIGLIDGVMSYEEVRQKMVGELSAKSPAPQVRFINGNLVTIHD